MAFTQLSTIATPGARRTFAPKTHGVKGEGPFTRLHVNALPGTNVAFYKKYHGIKGQGPFTKLHVNALPGKRPYEPPVEVPEEEPERRAMGPRGYGAEPPTKRRFVGMDYEELLREDEDLAELLAMIVSSGILDD